MRLSTKTRYAARALLDLALHEAETPVLLKDIAARQQISVMYLEQLMRPLIAAGIIRSIRGPKGGICLAKSPAEINLARIVRLFEGSMAPVECVNRPGVCPRSEYCVTRDVWGEVERAIDGVLETTSIQDLVERQRKKMPPEVVTYQI